MNFFLRLMLAGYKLVFMTGFFSTSPGQALFRQIYLWYKQFFEARHIRTLLQFVSPDAIVVDVGANIGYFTLQFAKCLNKGTVIALEPEQVNFSGLCWLIEKYKLSDRVKAVQAAVSDHPGELRLKIDPFHPGNHKLADDGVLVSVTTIDALVAEHGNPKVSFIKIDVQGAEKNVLSGAIQTLEQWYPAVFCEVDSKALGEFHTSAPELLQFMGDYDYHIYYLYQGNIVGPITIQQALQRQLAKGYTDFLFLHSTQTVNSSKRG
jgi:FkbM family methyltransferase